MLVFYAVHLNVLLDCQSNKQQYRMGITKSKILAIFLMVLFFQRIGPSIFLKTCIIEHIYKEQRIVSVKADKGRVCSPNLINLNNRIYEQCHNAVVNPPILFSPKASISYIEVQYPHDGGFVCMDTFLKQSALRGPPAC